MTLLAVRAISKSFAGLLALHDVDLSVDEGTIAGLIGPNGAGKTTLFNVIAGAIRPDLGTVHLAGHELAGLAPHRVARLGLARTFQLMRPFESMSVRDNVAMGALLHTPRLEAARHTAAGVVTRVGLEAWMDRPARALPTAGRKRLELARALAMQPRLLLLDEVLAGLVPAERTPVVELIRDVRDSGTTVVMVEHVMAAVMALCDQVTVLHHGEVLAQGTAHEVTSDQRVVDAYLGEELSVADP